jgi:hypothetical protein
MKALIKSFARKLLFKEQEPTSFPAVRIPAEGVNEKFILKTTGHEVDVSGSHCIVCHNPFCIAAWMDDIPENSAQAQVMLYQQQCATIDLTVVHRIPLQHKSLIIFRAEGAHNFQLSELRQTLVRRYFRNKNSVLEDRLYAAAYSYPRRVIAVSFKQGGYYNIFPMDFQCYLPTCESYILGLRTTNVTLEKILAAGRLVIGDTDAAEIDTLYALGKHHGDAPPAIDDLPFRSIESELFGFPVPGFSAGYKEIELAGHRKLGTHMLMIGKVVNSKTTRPWKSSIHHIHFFHATSSSYAKA